MELGVVVSHSIYATNTAEFCAVIVGLTCLARTGVTNAGVRLVGDSLTSLKWGESEKFKGTNCLAASVAFILLCIRFELHVAETEFVPGVVNVFYDRISRQVPPLALGVPPYLVMDLEKDTCIQQLLCLCDPTLDISSTSGLLKLWRSVEDWINNSVIVSV